MIPNKVTFTLDLLGTINSETFDSYGYVDAIQNLINPPFFLQNVNITKVVNVQLRRSLHFFSSLESTPRGIRVYTEIILPDIDNLTSNNVEGNSLSYGIIISFHPTDIQQRIVNAVKTGSAAYTIATKGNLGVTAVGVSAMSITYYETYDEISCRYKS